MKSKMHSRKTDDSTAVSAEERRRMVAEAAYFRALERGFQGGDPQEDWYCAEREIEQCLARSDKTDTPAVRSAKAHSAAVAARIVSK